MSFTVGGSTPQLTFADATVQNTAALPLTGGSVSADITVHGLTVGQGAGSVSTNTAVGASALASVSQSGLYNSAFAYGALANNTTGSGSTAGGLNALANNTTGGSNTAWGNSALVNNTTASYNTAVGYQAGYTNITNTGLVAMGYQAGRLSVADYNTFVGWSAGQAVTSGGSNTFIGQGAGYSMTTGSKNTIIGAYIGNQGGLDIRTLTNKVVLSDGDGNPYFILNNSSGSSRILNFDGSEFFPGTDNAISCGFSSYRWSVVYSATASINTSDANQKQQIADLTTAEKSVANSIKGLIKTFKFNEAVTKKGDNARIHIGVIAQEVQSAFIAQGLDPSRYALFCSDTWYEVDGNHLNSGGEFCKKTDEGAVEVTQLGIRYDELLAFVISTL